MLDASYPGVEARVAPGLTYCCELIDPKYRIIVDYGGRRELVLLAVIDTSTGVEQRPLPDIGLPCVRVVDSPQGFRALPQHRNDEGYVVRFASGDRIKVKNDEYMRINKMLTTTSQQTIWQALRDEVPLDEYIEHVPDEFHRWVRTTVDEIRENVSRIEQEAQEAYAGLVFLAGGSRKDLAMQVQRYPKHLQPLLFCLADGKDIRPLVWKLARPGQDAASYQRGTA